MTALTIDDGSLVAFGDPEGATFVLVTAPGLGTAFDLDLVGYPDGRVIEYSGEEPFASVLRDEVPEVAHVLVVLPNLYFRSPSPDELGPKRKLAVMACSSTPTSLDAIAHFLRMGARTDPAAQERMAEAFFAGGEATPYLRFVDDTYGTVATFEHLGEELGWHEQGGFLGWGQQQLFPSGEISVLPVSVFGQNIESRFTLNGRLAIRGVPILHSGTPSFLPADQQRLYEGLATLEEHALIVTVENGLITEVVPTAPDCAPAAAHFEAMRALDSRYSSLVEIGFGINTGLSLFPGNTAMNEVYGGTNGAVHLGFGLIPYTQYHLDVICPGIRVIGANDEHVFGEHREPAAVG